MSRRFETDSPRQIFIHMIKFCKSCQTEKPHTDFNTNKSRKDGLQTYCKICSRLKQKHDYLTNPKRRESVAKSRDDNYRYNRRLVEVYKRRCGCILCNETTTACLDFHHIDPSTKDIEVSILVGMSLTRLKDEIRKCVILCANCHRKVHANLISLRV